MNMSTEVKKTKKKMTGVVVSDKMEKSRVVVVEGKKKDVTYKKYLKTRKNFMVHDEENKSKRGNTVVIQETAPRSKRKKWEIVEILGHVDLEDEEGPNGNAGN
jgi:small subunit ribosomal protein S17